MTSVYRDDCRRGSSPSTTPPRDTRDPQPEPGAKDESVGRQHQLGALEEELPRVRERQPRVVLVQGPAGISKTALVQRLLLRLDDLRVFWGSGGAGPLLALARMDRAPLLCTQIAQDKAYSVASFGGLPTIDWWRLVESEPALLHGVVKTDRLVVFGGGVPLVADGRTVGAIGVSGGSSEQDVRVAEAEAAAVGHTSSNTAL